MKVRNMLSWHFLEAVARIIGPELTGFAGIVD